MSGPVIAAIDPHRADRRAAALGCGSRGYGPVRTLLLGSVSHAVVRQAACPVLVVPLAEPTDIATADARGMAAA